MGGHGPDFGQLLTDGNYSSGSYRFGFQGQEMDNEIKGTGNSINFKYRMHDARIGRFFAVDPIAAKFPHNSPYAFSENRVIDGIEYEGLEVVLIGIHGNASVGGSGTAEGGIALNIKNAGDNAGYFSVGIGGESNISAQAGICVTIYPTMPSVSDISGWGADLGASGNVVPMISVGIGRSTTNGYWGWYFQGLFGPSTLLVDGSGYATHTWKKKLNSSKSNLRTLKRGMKALTEASGLLHKQRQKLLDKDELSDKEEKRLNKLNTRIGLIDETINAIEVSIEQMTQELYGAPGQSVSTTNSADADNTAVNRTYVIPELDINEQERNSVMDVFLKSQEQ